MVHGEPVIAPTVTGPPLAGSTVTGPPLIGSTVTGSGPDPRIPEGRGVEEGRDVALVEDHARLIEMFEAAEDASRANREKAERDVDYYDGKQLTEQEVSELRKRGQPPVVSNRVRRKIEFLKGLERTQRTDPSALPRTPQHEDDAHAATDALRFVGQQNRYEQARSKAWADILRAGWGGVEIVAEPSAKGGNPRIVIRRCQWDRMFHDPYSAEEDYSDATYLGLVLWMDRDEAVRRYGTGAGQVFDETLSGAEVGGTFDDKPKVTTWIMSGKRPRVRVVQIYYLGEDGVWQFCEFTKGGYLNRGPSPFLDEDGEPAHPYVWRAAYVDRDNNRYGVVRDMIDPQDEVNKRKSKLLHLFTSRQTFGTEAALGKMTTRQLREQLARPDGHVSLAPNVEFGKQFGVIPTSDLSSGNVELLQEAKGEIDLMGPNAAMLGKGPADQSGRAIQAQQQGGSIEAGGLFDVLRDMDHEVYRKVWCGIRQFWTGEQWVRVTDDMKNLRWVGLNQPVLDPATGQVTIKAPLAALDVDIILDDAPHMGTLAGEQFKELVNLAQVGVVFPPKVYLAASELRNKQELLAMLEEGQNQPPDPVKAAAEQIELDNKAADTEHKRAQAAHVAAMAQKAQVGAAREHHELVGQQVAVEEAAQQRAGMSGPLGY